MCGLNLLCKEKQERLKEWFDLSCAADTHESFENVMHNKFGTETNCFVMDAEADRLILKWSRMWRTAAAAESAGVEPPRSGKGKERKAEVPMDLPARALTDKSGVVEESESTNCKSECD